MVFRLLPVGFRGAIMKPMSSLVLAILLIPGISFAQKLPGNFTCQDLIDTANGKMSRLVNGSHVPVNRPQPKDAFGLALLSHDTYLCQRLSRGEITVDEFNALHDEKVHQLQGERGLLIDQQKRLMEQKNLENQPRAIQIQRDTVEAQQAAIREQAQQSSSKLQKIASCGPNSLNRRFAKTPEIMRRDGGIHIETPRGQIHQDDEDRIVIGDIYIFKFERWSGEQSFPGGRTEALRFFEHHCSMAGRGNHPVVIEK